MKKLNEVFTVYKQLPPPEFIVENLILQDTISILAAGSNQGKTLLSVYLMLCLSEGKEFFGYKTKQQNVAYFDLEMTENLFCFRLSKQAKSVSESVFYSETIIDITEPGATEKFIEELKKENINFLIIDSYSQLIVGSEENSNSRQAEVMEQLYKFKRAGIGLFILHHKRKGANDNGLESLRGGSVVGAGADQVFMLSKDSSIFRFFTVKDRLLPQENWADIKYKFIEREGIITPEIEIYDRDTSIKYAIVEFLKEHNTATSNTIVSNVNFKRATTLETLKLMVQEGILNQTPKDPKPRQKTTYSLAIPNQNEIDTKIDEIEEIF